MIVSMSARVLEEGTKYKLFKPIIITQDKMEEKINFLKESFLEEVMNVQEGKRKTKIKQLKKIIRLSVSILAGLSIQPTALAAEKAELLTPLSPQMVLEWSLNVALISVAAGVGASMVLLSIAGMYRMMRKRRESAEWTTDIVKGLVQVLISVPTVYLFYFLAQLLFQNFPMLSKLF